MKKYITHIKNSLIFNVAIIALACFSVILLVYELSAAPSPDILRTIYLIDFCIALFFLLDFSLGIYASTDRKKYIQENWLDLIASIPVTQEMNQSFRVLRLLRVLRVVARLRKIPHIAHAITRQSVRYVYAITLTLTVILAGAVSFFTFEFGINPLVNNFFDAVWWSVSMATTAGIGDINPVTWEGRIVAMGLMFYGIALLGGIAGLIGSQLLEKYDIKER